MHDTATPNVFDVRAWVDKQVDDQNKKHGSGISRRKLSTAQTRSYTIPIRNEPFTLTYELADGDAPEDGYELSVSVPAGHRVEIRAYGRYASIGSRETVLTVFDGGVALSTLKKGRGFRVPQVRRQTISRSTRRVA